MERDKPAARFAYIAWNRFYELSMPASSRHSRNQREFIDSKYYASFYKFGKHMVEIDALDPNKFIDFVLSGNIPIEQWCNDIVYQSYVRELTKKESPEAALERNILLMQQWSRENGEPWTEFFRRTNFSQLLSWLQSGRLSPWVLYSAESAGEFLSKCSTEQAELLRKYAPTRKGYENG